MSKSMENNKNQTFTTTSKEPWYAQAIAKMHEEAGTLEAEGTALLVKKQLHNAHNHFDIARCLRSAANYLDGIASS